MPMQEISTTHLTEILLPQVDSDNLRTGAKIAMVEAALVSLGNIGFVELKRAHNPTDADVAALAVPGILIDAKTDDAERASIGVKLDASQTTLATIADPTRENLQAAMMAAGLDADLIKDKINMIAIEARAPFYTPQDPDTLFNGEATYRAGITAIADMVPGAPRTDDAYYHVDAVSYSANNQNAKQDWTVIGPEGIEDLGKTYRRMYNAGAWSEFELFSSAGGGAAKYDEWTPALTPYIWPDSIQTFIASGVSIVAERTPNGNGTTTLDGVTVSRILSSQAIKFTLPTGHVGGRFFFRFWNISTVASFPQHWIQIENPGDWDVKVVEESTPFSVGKPGIFKADSSAGSITVQMDVPEGVEVLEMRVRMSRDEIQTAWGFEA